ncbi:MAG: DoxX family protein [Bacteroidetes bacterium]|nr:DoxX family protein [Bacteroidota bacterium]
MEILILIARFLFSLIFLMSGMGHFTQAKTMAEYTKSKKVPAPGLAVFVTGIMLLLGGLSILLGAFVNVGAILLIIFLIPTAFIMHNFWTVKDPMMKQQDQINFMKDLALAGAAFLIWYLYQTVPVPLSLAQ